MVYNKTQSVMVYNKTHIITIKNALANLQNDNAGNLGRSPLGTYTNTITRT